MAKATFMVAFDTKNVEREVKDLVLPVQSTNTTNSMLK